MCKKRKMMGILILAIGAGTLLAAGIWWHIPQMPFFWRMVTRILFIIGAVIFWLHVRHGMLPYLKEEEEMPDSGAVPCCFVASILLMALAVVILYITG